MALNPYFRHLLGALGLTLLASTASAQTPNPAPIVLQASTLTGERFDVGALKGKVVMLFYWSTDCAVCRSHLPELRANLAGWKGKPFELVTVNVDKDMAGWRDYEKIVAQTHSVRPTAVWQGGIMRTKLPVTVVLDVQGREVAHHEGRIAPEAWDDVAALLP
jgi:thiol-disulfide isomerase/thioredoxin